MNEEKKLTPWPHRFEHRVEVNIFWDSVRNKWVASDGKDFWLIPEGRGDTPPAALEDFIAKLVPQWIKSETEGMEKWPSDYVED